ncbi:MAG: hypothetical protein KDD10_17890, partial [Phaeodactylibacter sp.]|nr:hypothetical protein [Phaeodactylibacter sp.]
MTKALLRTLSCLFLAFGLTHAHGQSNCSAPGNQAPLNGNNIRAVILTGGDLFWDGNDGRFQVPYRPGGPGT